MYAESSSDANLLMLMQTAGGPLAVMLFGLLLCWWLRRRLSPLAVMLPAVAIGFWISYGWIQGRSGLPPQQAMDVLIPLLLSVLLLELALPRLNLSRYGQMTVSVLLVVGFSAWMLYPILSRSSGFDAFLLLLAAGLFYLLLQSGFGGRGCDNVRDAVGVTMVAAAAPVFAVDGSLLLAQLSGALAAGLGVLWLAGLLIRPLANSVVVFTPAMTTALYVAAHQYAEVNSVALLLISVGTLLVVQIRRWWPVASVPVDNFRVLLLAAVPFTASLWLIWPEQSLY